MEGSAASCDQQQNRETGYNARGEESSTENLGNAQFWHEFHLHNSNGKGAFMTLLTPQKVDAESNKYI